jgi:hypothetical protein
MMPKINRLTGRFFTVLISVTVAVLLPRAVVAGEASPRPPLVSPAAAGFVPGLPPTHPYIKDATAELKLAGPLFAEWPTQRRFTPLRLEHRAPVMVAGVVSLANRSVAANLLAAGGAAKAPGPTLCQISDTVYRADGSPAQGTMLLSWPAFTTAAGQAVSPGSLLVTLDANGGFNASLAPNTGASPVGTFYKAIFRLSDDAVQPAWAGEYRVLSDFLPASDVLPANAVQVAVPSRGAAFRAIVREVDVEVVSLADDRSLYAIRFANDAAGLLAFEFDSMTLTQPVTTIFTTTTPSSSMYIAPLTAAQVTDVIATYITVDAGVAPPAGGGIEVRRSDAGWGPGADGNLAGRFTTQTFTLPRLSRVQSYYLRQYDGSSPAKYSRDSALLHVDYPL